MMIEQLKIIQENAHKVPELQMAVDSVSATVVYKTGEIKVHRGSSLSEYRTFLMLCVDAMEAAGLAEFARHSRRFHSPDVWWHRWLLTPEGFVPMVSRAEFASRHDGDEALALAALVAETMEAL